MGSTAGGSTMAGARESSGRFGLSTLREPPPALPPEAVVRIARDAFGIGGTAPTFFPSERDQVCRLSVRDGDGVVVRIANAAEDAEVLDLQNRALDHVAQRDPTLPVPRVRRTRAGTDKHREGDRWWVRVFTFLPGVPATARPASAALRVRVGATLGRFDRALSDFAHPAAAHRLIWDIQHAAEVAELVRHVPGKEARALLRRTFDRFADGLAPRFGELPGQVIHNDLNRKNILIDAAGAEAVTGIIDFGDMVHTRRVFDLAVAVARQIDEDDPAGQAASVVAGYGSVVALLPAEIDLLPDLVATRLAVSVAIRAWRAGLGVGSSAGEAENRAAALGLIACLARLDPARMTDRLKQAAAGSEGRPP